MKKLWRKISKSVSENFFAEPLSFWAVVPFLFALGIALYFCFDSEPNVWLSVGVLELWLLLFYLCRYKNLHYFFIGGLIVIAGFLNMEAHSIYQECKVEKIAGKEMIYIRGQVSNITKSEKGKIRVELENAADYNKPLKGRFRITLGTGDVADININQCVEMVATLFANRQVPVKNGFQLDRKYFYEGLSATGYANSEVFEIRCPEGAESGGLKAQINVVRNEVMDYIAKVLPAAEAGVADALLVGEKSYIEPQIADNYRNAGLAHFLSVSGLHLGSIAALVFFVVRFLLALFPWVALRYDIKKIAAVAAIGFSALYLLMSGMAIPAQRAFIMTAVVLIGVLCNRQAISMRMVSFAALTILVIEPQTLISVSFQMSFAAVYALVAFYETFTGKLAVWAPRGSFVLKVLWYLLGIVMADMVASLATLPFALYHFHRVAVYTSLGNLLAGPLIGLFLMPMVLCCLAGLPLHLAYYPLKALGFGLGILNKITDYVAHLPHSVWYNDNLPFGGLMLMVVGGYWLCVWRNRWRRWGIVPIFVALPLIFVGHRQPDVVFSPRVEDVAVRDNAGNMRWLPYKRNSWLEQVWAENLQVRALDKEDRRTFKAATLGEDKLIVGKSGLVCNEQSCVYRERVEISFEDGLSIDGKPVNTDDGGYVYFSEKGIEWEALRDVRQCRVWQNCEKK